MKSNRGNWSKCFVAGIYGIFWISITACSISTPYPTVAQQSPAISTPTTSPYPAPPQSLPYPIDSAPSPVVKRDIPSPTPTPVIAWLVHAKVIPWESLRKIDEIQWKSNTVAIVRAWSLFENGTFAVTQAADGSLVKSQVVATPSPASTGNVVWSPNLKRMAVFRMPNNSATKALLQVFDAHGTLQTEFQVDSGHGEGVIGWLTNDVVARYSQWGNLYFDANTGQPLFDYPSQPMGAGWFHQYPTLSPNQRWITLDRGEDTVKQIPRRFSVYDLENKRDYLLTDEPGIYGVFLDWAEDSSLLYWIKRPARSIASGNDNANYGLLAFDAQTHLSKLLFKNALNAIVNPQTHRAFVLFPKAEPNRQAVLFGGILDLRSGALIGSQQISDQVKYYDPAWEFLADSDFASGVWAHDGKRIVFGNSKGEIKILKVDGTVRTLTTTFSTYLEPLQTFAWSPDDKHLLVNQGYQAWILDIPEQ